ncbi:unnamed protein product [Blepharisma stoltei]|uniref:Uncharacterized protein n=1 Tax=Blepharisma stoltei TaxID=1481888 RepID=A0AAU9JEX8_9CILI|nr:unnamed protein product [Blepharisma stoltei]
MGCNISYCRKSDNSCKSKIGSGFIQFYRTGILKIDTFYTTCESLTSQAFANMRSFKHNKKQFYQQLNFGSQCEEIYPGIPFKMLIATLKADGEEINFISEYPYLEYNGDSPLFMSYRSYTESLLLCKEVLENVRPKLIENLGIAINITFSIVQIAEKEELNLEKKLLASMTSQQNLQRLREAEMKIKRYFYRTQSELRALEDSKEECEVKMPQLEEIADFNMDLTLQSRINIAGDNI